MSEPEEMVTLTATIRIEYTCPRSVYQECAGSNGLLDFAAFDRDVLKKNPDAIAQLIKEGNPDRVDITVTARDV